jgi:hypothetical protein
MEAQSTGSPAMIMPSAAIAALVSDSSRKISPWFWMACFLAIASFETDAAEGIHFNRDVRPLLSEQCFQCHGFDANTRKSGLRLDLREEALKPAKSGVIPLVPGKPEASELFRRITSADPDAQMPPAPEHAPLTAAQREILRQWILAGAEYEPHWAFVPPVRQPSPEVSPSSRTYNPIDRFILERLEQAGLSPSPEAAPEILFRRLTLDLTGLPPSPDEVQAFLQDPSSEAYERWVDRRLASPRWGERMAQDWLDVARFADSNGYQVDRDRELWAWRDWVVRALNRNQPFDQFTIEQLAGDLLPSPTLDQRIATGFHRNHMINEEGGIIPEEFLAEYCFDRVETTATAWLGLTFTCARCHDHKFDPISQRDYYGLYAFFHNITEKGVGDYGVPIRRSTPPMLQIPSPEQQDRLDREHATLRSEESLLAQRRPEIVADPESWAVNLRAHPVAWETSGTTLLPVHSGTNRSIRLTWDSPATALRLTFRPTGTGGSSLPRRIALGELRLRKAGQNRPLALRARSTPDSRAADSVAPALDDKLDTAFTLDWTTQPEVRIVLLPEVSPEGIYGEPTAKALELELLYRDTAGASEIELRVDTTREPLERIPTPLIADLLARPNADWSPDHRRQIEEFRLDSEAGFQRLQKSIQQRQRDLEVLDLSIPVTLVMVEAEEPRPTHVLLRGAYDRKGEPVKPASPRLLPPMSKSGRPDRLALARWLVSPENPLPARVIMNRWWQTLLGTGLVRTTEDFGSQGEPPSHPELLDWLAREFVDSGWDQKHMVRLMVTSATYRQASQIRPETLAKDPENRLLSRGPRFRWSAEIIRDSALAASGLLIEIHGGAPVKPYHPPGLYEQVVAGSSANTYEQDHGTALYRRTLYTYWKRSVPNPALLLFDRPFRETCVTRRSRTSTPLQALNLLNDPTYVEAARFLAQRLVRETPDADARIRSAFQRILGRHPSDREHQILSLGVNRTRAHFAQDPSAASQLLTVGESKADPSLDPVELASWTLTVGSILNLEETLTRQ